jgi:predicted nucleotidyltransferase
MVATRQEAMEIAAKTKAELQKLYGGRLKNVYLYGSAARDQLTPDSDIDIAIILDHIENSFLEHERTSELGTELSLERDTVVCFFFAEEADFARGRFAIHRHIKAEGIPA